MENFTNKIAVVTGSSSGIGAALSKELVKRGCIVMGLARRMDRLQTLSEDICKMPDVNKGSFHPFQCDITVERQIQETFIKIETSFGIPSVLVNNAGVTVDKPFMDIDAKIFDTVVNTNARGILLCTKIAANLMSKNCVPGHILNVNSVAGHYISMADFNLTYAGSKHMARIFTEGIREMMTKNKWNIKISNMSPGLVKTEMIDKKPKFAHLLSSSSSTLTVEDVVQACISILDTPPNVLISELIIMQIHQFIKEMPKSN